MQIKTTRVCFPHQHGECNFGDNCWYSQLLDKLEAKQHHSVENLLTVSEEDAVEDEVVIEAVEADKTR